MTKSMLYDKAQQLPLLPGVYIIRDKNNTIVYIGKAKKLRTRVSQYFRNGVPHDEKTTRMVNAADEFDVIVTTSEFEALVLEASQIKQHKPKYNILLKDDKGYSYVKITKEPYPRITAELQLGDDNAEYIGPFTSSFAVREMVETACLTFKIPTCSRNFPADFGKQRPCLNKHIGRCMGVCTGRISESDYREAIDGAVRLIRYGKQGMIKALKQQMEQASEQMFFEKAALLRDQIKAIERLSEGQRVVGDAVKDQDVLAFTGSGSAVCVAILRFRDGRMIDKKEFVYYDTQDVEKVREEYIAQYYVGNEELPKTIAIDKKIEDQQLLMKVLSEQYGSKVKIYVPEKGDNQRLVQMAYINATERLAREHGRGARGVRALDELANLLALKEPPQVIEAYDISNWGDGTSVCGMVVFEEGKPKKSGYRRFAIKTVEGTDDFASMAEALSRRAAEYEKGAKGQFGVMPNLILLDGGKGQLSSVVAALKGTAFEQVPVFGMVKDDKHRTRALIGAGGEIAIAMHRGIFTFITNVQDEVHRFAISYQRQKQSSKAFSSSLTKIDGIGPSTARTLLAYFRTIKSIAAASQQELAAVKGINARQAQAIYDFFNS